MIVCIFTFSDKLYIYLVDKYALYIYAIKYDETDKRILNHLLYYTYTTLKNFRYKL